MQYVRVVTRVGCVRSVLSVPYPLRPVCALAKGATPPQRRRGPQPQGTPGTSFSHSNVVPLDLGRAPYGVYAVKVKYIDPVSLDAPKARQSCTLTWVVRPMFCMGLNI